MNNVSALIGQLVYTASEVNRVTNFAVNVGVAGHCGMVTVYVLKSKTDYNEMLAAGDVFEWHPDRGVQLQTIIDNLDSILANKSLPNLPMVARGHKSVPDLCAPALKTVVETRDGLVRVDEAEATYRKCLSCNEVVHRADFQRGEVVCDVCRAEQGATV